MSCFRCIPWVIPVVLVVALGCSDDDDDVTRDTGVTSDGSKVADRGIFPDGYKLYSCKTPGQTCNAHDPCAINPICGKDGLCRPQGLMDCDDGLSCTIDRCAGLGVCENTPKAGWCRLGVVVGGPPTSDAGAADGGAGDASSTGLDASLPDYGVPRTVFKCYKKGDRHPTDNCLVCDPGSDDASTGGSPTKWTPANGGACDDRDACTKNDYCQYGICKGTSYRTQCADTYGCTQDLCDGKGGCLGNKLKSGWCLINGVCYQDKAADPSGKCNTCDPKNNPAAWTPVTNTCTIDNKCYATGAPNPTGCGECDPAVSTTKWTVKGTTCCLIKKTAYKSGVKDSTGCSTCDPTKDKYGWTPVTGKCKINDKCYSDGTTHPKGCAKCDTSVSATSWTILSTTTMCLIGGECYNAGDKDTVGCATCDPTKSKTSWTKTPGCFKIVFTALNKAYQGNLGGASAADALCQQQAQSAGFSGTFKAFLSTSKRDAKDLVSAANASNPVINTKGQVLYASWSSMFTATKWSTTSYRIYTFNGTEVDEGNVSPDWYDGRAWNGSDTAGKVRSGYTCSDWTTSSTSAQGATGELDYGNVEWPSGTSTTYVYEYCDEYQAVVCVQIAP